MQGKEHGRLLSDLARVQQEERVVSVDSCFLGLAVCGKVRWKAVLRERWGSGAEPVKLVCSKRAYRFGCGSQVTVETWELSVQVGDERGLVVVDVVNGALPFLVGSEFQERFAVVVDGYNRKIWQARGEPWKEVGSYERGRMPGLDVFGLGRGGILVSQEGKVVDGEEATDTESVGLGGDLGMTTVSGETGTPQTPSRWG